MTMLENLVSDLEKYLETSLERKESKEGTSYEFRLNDGSTVYLREKQSGIYLHSNICHFQEKEIPSPEDIYIYLMKANYLGQGTGGSVISISPDEKFLTLSHLIAYEVNYKMFRDLLEDFVNYVSFWRKEMNTKLTIDK